jgi:hypothetical protein
MMLTPDYPTCKNEAVSARWVAASLLLIVILGGCTTVETQSFNVPQDRQVESAYIAADADFGKYDRLHAVDMGIFFPQDSYTPPEDIRRIRQIFRSAFLEELKNYTIVESAGPGAMTVQATLIDFRNSSSGSLMSLQKDLRDIASQGEILFLMEMRDSQSDAVLARAADSARTPVIATAKGDSTDWSSVEEAARHWATLFRQFLDQNLGR